MPVALLSDIVIISIIVIITLMIYRNMKFLLSPIPSCVCVVSVYVSVYMCVLCVYAPMCVCTCMVAHPNLLIYT